MVYIRKKQKEFGLQEHIVGDLPKESRCVLVEDLNTDGKSKIHFADVIRSSGSQVRTVFSVFNYGVFPGVEETFERSGLDLLYLTDWPTAIEVGIDCGYFRADEARELQNYLRDPVRWSNSRSVDA
jgi:orotate phosphoribosyltransferase